jgi:ubiquinone biosynthesis protein
VKGLPLFLLCLPLPALAVGQAAARLELPTPRSHYESYDWRADARALATEIGAALPESTRNEALAFLASDGRELDEEKVRALLEAVDWKRYRPRIARILLHGSQVLEVVPDEASAWRPLVHDALLLFLDGLSDERFLERIRAQIDLPREAARGERVLGFVVNAPSLQKLAQILARNPSLAPDIRLALQTLENGITSVRYDDVMAEIERELDPGVVREHSIEFREELLAEASVGAVIEASYRDPESEVEGRAACKVLKPGAVEALAEDLAIIDDVLEFLELHGDFYDIGETPLVDIFREIREALSREVRVSDERKNLERAGEYYRGTRIQIPAVLPFSTENVTCMEFVEGVKITDAFPGRAGDRARLARRLSDALTFDVLFTGNDPSLFHGDPHAGNVFHVTADPADPYRIALIDWGLAADFTRREREQLVQVMLGLYLGDGKRLANNVDVLVDFPPGSEQKPSELGPFLESMVSGSRGSEGMFPKLDDLLTGLAKLGLKVRYDAAIFIKSQLTISGILEELDPGFEQDDYVMGRISGQVFREVGPRLLRTVWFPAWNSHEYRSLMSNEDVKDVQVQRTGRFFKKVGKGIWTAVSFQWLF